MCEIIYAVVNMKDGNVTPFKNKQDRNEYQKFFDPKDIVLKEFTLRDSLKVKEYWCIRFHRIFTRKDLSSWHENIHLSKRLINDVEYPDLVLHEDNFEMNNNECKICFHVPVDKDDVNDEILKDKYYNHIKIHVNFLIKLFSKYNENRLLEELSKIKEGLY